ncbi:gamma-glutamylcyclotransferase family protein [Inquilinus limosus]|uniref:gamma-glutamylcyclotransferase family protein n=1 Tax=Inquilinus limosus TaxID=171674 RepID=UPI0004011FFC|nr:gamma-glutamylcyclotransferase family protein [Inquilinus limosus]
MTSGLAVLVLASAAPGAGAAEWWGKKLPGQPQNFIFGYGSLINTASRNSTASKPIDAIPVRVSASFGYVRAWVDRAKSGFTALGLRKPKAGEQAMTINGVLYPVEGDDMGAFDAREAGYKRMEVPRDAIEAVSWEQAPPEGKIWVYVSVGKDGTPGEGLEPPSADYPLLQSYVDGSSTAPWNTAPTTPAS